MVYSETAPLLATLCKREKAIYMQFEGGTYLRGGTDLKGSTDLKGGTCLNPCHPVMIREWAGDRGYDKGVGW